MALDAAALTFQAEDFDSCTAIVRQFFRERPSANIIRVALSTNDLRPLGARVWQVVDGDFEATTNIIVGFIMTQPHGSVTISVRVQ
jgi:hypothetical protein